METDERFWTTFRMLGSKHDAEALVALRSLQKTLLEDGISWNVFCDLLIQGGVSAPPPLTLRDLVVAAKESMRTKVMEKFPEADEKFVKGAVARIIMREVLR